MTQTDLGFYGATPVVCAYDPALDDEPTERLLTVAQDCARDGQISLTVGVSLDLLSDADVVTLEQTFRIERYKRGLL